MLPSSPYAGMIRIRFYGLEAGVASSQTFMQVTPRTRAF